MITFGGVGALAVTLLLFGWAYGTMRRPDPKPWAENEAVATGVALVLTTLLAFVSVLLIKSAVQYETVLAEIGVPGLAAAAGVVVAGGLLARLLMAPARGRSETASQGVINMPDTPPDAANDNAAIIRHAA